jgi:hypothetical protein
MMASTEQKKELKKVLYGLATPEEKRELNALEASELNERLNAIAKYIGEFLSENKIKNQNLGTVLATLFDSVDVVRRSSSRVPDKVSERMEPAFERLAKVLVDKLEELKQTHGKTEVLTVPLYKTMIESISEVNQSVKNIPTPVWRWPQYASVSVRNKNFANVNPSISPFGIEDYDDIQLSYTGSNLTGVNYLLNGKVVAVLALTYVGSNLTEVKRTQ